MECRDMQNLIWPFLDGELPAVDAAAVQEHLAACPACRREAELCARLTATLRETASSPVEAPPDLCRNVMARIRAGRRKPLAGLSAAWKRGLAAAAAVLLIAGSALGLTNGFKLADKGGSVVGFRLPDKLTAQGGNGTNKTSAPDQMQDKVPTGRSRQDKPGASPAPNTAGGKNSPQTAAPAGASMPGPQVSPPRPGSNSGASGSTPVAASSTGPVPAVLLSSTMKINSTLLKVAVADAAGARIKAVALAAGAGATTQVFPVQNSGGKEIIVLRMTLDNSRAGQLINQLAGLGTIIDRQDDSRDITALYNQTLAQYQDFIARRDAAQDPTQRRQLDLQATALKQQLDSWAAEAGKYVIVLWLQNP